MQGRRSLALTTRIRHPSIPNYGPAGRAPDVSASRAATGEVVCRAVKSGRQVVVGFTIASWEAAAAASASPWCRMLRGPCLMIHTPG
jgi:hypothetical protein